MNYCVKCGARLVKKSNGIDGLVPYCPHCKEFRFFKFSSAVSAIIFNPERTKILLLQQYGNPSYILLSGYINRGENAKQTLVREIREETKLTIDHFTYNDNAYYAPHDVLMHNYAVVVRDDQVHPNNEIDHYEWVPVSKSAKLIMQGSLAQSFLKEWLGKTQLLK